MSFALRLSASPTHPVTTTYDNDAIDQLTKEEVSGAWKQEYDYDANGNRSLFKKYNWVSGAWNVQVNDTYSYNPGDLLMTAGSKTFTYDNCGRMKTVTVGGTLQKTYHYDYQDRLITTQYPDGTGTSDTYLYNGMHARVSQTINGTTRTYKRDGTSVTSPVLTEGGRQHTPGVSYRESSATKYGFQDRLGTNTHEYNSSSVNTSEKDFDAFGNEKSTSGSTNNPFGFAGNWGYQKDSSSGLQLLGHRYYDPTIGRFLTRDPIKDGRNWFAYCDNNPLKRVDPDGLEWHDPGIVYVDPKFKGKVIIIGEQEGDGNKQVQLELGPGMHSNPHIDVDIIIVILPNGKQEIYAFIGWRLAPLPHNPQLAIVGADGVVRGPNIHKDNAWTGAFASNMLENLDPHAPIRYPNRKGYPDMDKYSHHFDPHRTDRSPISKPHPSSRFQQ